MSHLVVIGAGFQECCLVDAHEGRKFFKCVGAVEDAPLDGVLDVHARVGLTVRDHGAVVVDHLETHTPVLLHQGDRHVSSTATLVAEAFAGLVHVDALIGGSDGCFGGVEHGVHEGEDHLVEGQFGEGGAYFCGHADAVSSVSVVVVAVEGVEILPVPHLVVLFQHILVVGIASRGDNDTVFCAHGVRVAVCTAANDASYAIAFGDELGCRRGEQDAKIESFHLSFEHVEIAFSIHVF